MRYIIILAVLFFTLPAFSQQYLVKYTYDNAGNRKKRTVVPLFIQKHTGNSTVKADMPGTAVKAREDITQKEAEEAITATSGAYTFKIYPNPTLGKIQVEAEQTFIERNNKKVYVFDLRGRLLQEKNISSNLFPIDFSAYLPGTYIVRIMAEGYKNEFEVVKQ